MSRESEDAFDVLQAKAIEKQTIELYFLAVLPDGQAMHVTSSMMPEVLEELGQIPMPRAFTDAGVIDYQKKINARGTRLARLMNRVFNPMLTMLTEKLIAMHHDPKQKP